MDVLEATRSRAPPDLADAAGRPLSAGVSGDARQGGRFLDLCYTPELAAEVTLQPIRRFGFDAAILFADILLVPHALGRRVRFVEGEGPVLETVAGGSAWRRSRLEDLPATTGAGV